MDGSPSAVLTLGLGDWGSPSLLITLGLGVGEVEEIAVPTLFAVLPPNYGHAALPFNRGHLVMPHNKGHLTIPDQR